VLREYFASFCKQKFLQLRLEIDNLHFLHSHRFCLYRNILNLNGHMLSIGYLSGQLILLCQRRLDRQRTIFLTRNGASLDGSEGHLKMPLQPSNTPNYQLIALTFTGGWYRLALPKLTSTLKSTGSPSLGSSPLPGSPPKLPRPPRSVSGSSAISKLDKGKEKDREKDNKEGRDCTLKEYRRYGRWDGWG
jgi:hypothetical protein